MGLQCGDAGADRDLGSRLRAARQKAQGREVEAGGSGILSRWTGGPRPEKEEESGAKSGADQTKGGRWGGIRYTEGDRKQSRKQLKRWDGDI